MIKLVNDSEDIKKKNIMPYEIKINDKYPIT